MTSKVQSKNFGELDIVVINQFGSSKDNIKKME
jgi:hypothetical protein